MSNLFCSLFNYTCRLLSIIIFIDIGIVLVLSCPVVHATQFLSVSCPWGSRYGSQCEFNCGPGTERNGSQAVCEKSESGEYGYWTFGDMQPFCKGLLNKHAMVYPIY